MSTDFLQDCYEDEAQEDSDALSWSAELHEIFTLAYPAAIQLLFQYGITVVNQMMAGSLGKEALAAAAIGTTWFNLMWYFLLGISTALDTLASQAYGAGDRPGCLAWCVSGGVVMSITGLPMAVGLFLAEPVAAIAFSQPPPLAKKVAVYCQGMIPGLWPFILLLVVMKAMQSQNVMQPAAWITSLMFFLNIPINWIMIHWWGFEGAAYAQSVVRALWFLLMLGAILTVGRKCLALNEPVSTFAGGELSAPTPNSLGEEKRGQLEASLKDGALDQPLLAGVNPAGLLEFAKLGLPGGGMMALDAGSWDITTAMAGFLGTVAVDAHTTLLNVCICSFMAAVFGVATAASIRVGNMLGAGRYRLARLSGNLSIGMAMFNMVLVSILIFSTRNVLGLLFVDDDEVVALVAKVAWLAALYQPADGLFGASSGVLRGLGYQLYLMVNNLVGFWLVGMTSAGLLAFNAGLGIEGLWIGTILGVLTSAFLNTIALLRVNWKKESEIAKAVTLKAIADFEAEEQQHQQQQHEQQQQQRQSSQPAANAGEAQADVIVPTSDPELAITAARVQTPFEGAGEGWQ